MIAFIDEVVNFVQIQVKFLIYYSRGKWGKSNQMVSWMFYPLFR